MSARPSLSSWIRIVAFASCTFAGTVLAGCASDAESADEPAVEQQDEAFTSFPSGPSSSDYPTDSGWALAMIADACDVSRAALEGSTGTITRAANGEPGVIYRASVGSRVVASAWARSTFILAQKRCLTK